jgi:hypothetical protein
VKERERVEIVTKRHIRCSKLEKALQQCGRRFIGRFAKVLSPHLTKFLRLHGMFPCNL